MTKCPKLLPWLARRAGISMELAEKLWRRAASDAAELTGSSEGPEFSRFAIEALIDLIEDECCRENVEAAPRSDWFWRHQRRMAAYSFKVANLGHPLWNQFLRQLKQTSTPA